MSQLPPDFTAAVQASAKSLIAAGTKLKWALTFNMPAR